MCDASNSVDCDCHGTLMLRNEGLSCRIEKAMPGGLECDGCKGVGQGQQPSRALSSHRSALTHNVHRGISTSQPRRAR